MPQNWKTYKLGELIKINSNSIKKGNFETINYIDIKSVGTGFYETPRKLLFKDAPSRARRLLKEGDTVISSVRPNLKAFFYSQNLLVNSVASTGFAVLTPIEINPRFLYYLTTNDNYINYLIKSCTGSAYPAFSHNVILESEVLIPISHQEQTAIASILSTIDDKIELNLQMNKTLEEMAMALYKHWFVDFGPFQEGEFVNSELGEIPKGWEVKKLVDFVDLTMGQSPKSEFYNDNQEGLPFHQGVSNYGIRYPKDVTYSTSGNRFADKGDILFSVRAPVGRLNISKNKIILGRGLASMRMKGNNSFLFYSLKSMFSSEDIIGSGTVFNSVNKTDLQNLEFILPNSEILNRFKTILEPIDNAYLNTNSEIETLTQLRDTLLPKLISGEVRVK